MISYFLIIFFIVTIIIYCSFNAFIKSNIVSSKNRIRLKLILLIFTFSILSTFLYLKLSNFWIGKSTIEKVTFKTNITNKEANEIQIIKKIMEELNKKIIKDPTNLEVILQLAETKFLLGYLDDALNLYKKARSISPENIEIKKAETQVRVILETNKLSKETLDLFNQILLVEPKNLLALYILGHHAFDKNNYSEAYQMFKVLKGLLKEGSQEYNDIEKKILEMEKRNEKHNK